MRLTVYSYTGSNGVADTTINDLSNFRAKILNNAIVPSSQATRIDRGNGQEPIIAGMKLRGVDLQIMVTCLQASVGDGFDLLAAMFADTDTRDKTLVLKDADDGDRQWYLTCLNKGALAAVGRNVICEVALKSKVLLTVNTNTETTWNTSATHTVSVGNSECYPVHEISVAAAGNLGQRYCRFIKARNSTQNTAIAYPINITDDGTGTGTLDSAALVNYTAVSVQVNGSSVDNNPATVTVPYDTPVGGAGWTGLQLPFLLYRNGEQMRVTARTGGPTYASGNLTVVRAVNGSVISAHADNTVLALSKAAFDGRDVRVLVGDGSGPLTATPYWFGTGANAWNTAATKIWCNKTFPARTQAFLSADIDSAATSMTVYDAEGNIDTTNAMLYFSGGTEVTAYAAHNPSTNVTSGMSLRASETGTAGAHVAGEYVYYITEMWLYYGDPVATTPTYNTSTTYLAQKPSFALTSTNNQWVFNSFASSTANTPYEFTATPPLNSPPVNSAYVFSANTTAVPFTNPAPADPVTEIGVTVLALNSIAKWQLNLPFGATSIVCANINRLNLPAAPMATAQLRASDGTTSVIASQGATWATTASQTLTPASSVTYLFQLYLKNTSTAAYTKRAAIGIETVTVNHNTDTVNSTAGRPYVAMGSEQSVDVDVDTTLANTTTGESLRIKFPNLAIGYTLRIDTLNKVVTYTKNGSKPYTVIQPYPARDNWLRYAQGANAVTCSQTGLSIITKEQYRNNSIG